MHVPDTLTSEGACSLWDMHAHVQPETTDLAYWNGRFFLWCLSRRPAWAMTKDLRGWPRQIRPTVRA